MANVHFHALPVTERKANPGLGSEVGLHIEAPPAVSVPCGGLVGPGMTGRATVSSSCSPLVLDADRSVWINEFHYDNHGLDENEFVEVAGVAGTDLAGWRLILYNGETGQSYDTIHLSGVIPDEGCGFGAMYFATPGLQNGAVAGFSQGDGIALVRDPWDRVVQLISYEGSFVASGGAAAGATSADIGVAEADTTAVSESVQCSGAYGSFVWHGPAARSPGRLNAGQTFDPCSGAVVLSWSDAFAPADCPASGTITRTWTARDSCGQSASQVQTIDLADREAPLFSSFPADLTIECGQSTDPEFTGGWPSAADGCAWQFALSGVWINEFHYEDETGDPENDFIEVAGVAGLDLTGCALVYYDGSGKRYGGVQYLSGTIPEDRGSGYGTLVFRPRAVTGIGLQNGPADGFALVHLPTEQVIQFLSYEGTLSALNGPAAGRSSTEIGAAEGPSTPAGASIQLAGAATFWTSLSWSNAAGSPGAVNAGQDLPKVDQSPAISFTDTLVPGLGQAPGITTISRTWTAVDACGNGSSRVQSITVHDAEPPSLNPPGPILVAGCVETAVPDLEYSEIPRRITLAQFETAGGQAWDSCGLESITYMDAKAAGQPTVVIRTFTAADAAGNSASAVQTITFDRQDVVILTEPADQMVCPGTSARFEVTADGRGLAYQWRKNGQPISGATAAVLALNTVSGADAGAYDVVVSGSCGSVVSRAATLAVPDAVVIITEPADQMVCPGSSARFEVTAGGSGLVYQWRKNGQPISGATAAVLALNTVSGADAGAYDVLVSGSCGSVVSRAASLVVPDAVVILTEPADQMVCPGSSARFEVTAGGSGLAYQWRKNGQPISGAVERLLELGAVAASDSGVYDVLVAGNCGVVESLPAVLTVLAPEPVITACATDLILSAEEEGAILPDLTGEVAATDGCASAALQISQSPLPGTVVAPGETEVVFTVRNPSGLEARCQCKVTVVQPSPDPILSIGDTMILEGSDGVREAAFIVSLSAPSARPVSVSFETSSVPGTAAAMPGVDYVQTSGTLIFEPQEPGTSTGSRSAANTAGIRLHLTRAGDELCAAWTAPYELYQLQERVSFNTQAEWQDVHLPVSGEGAEKSVILPVFRPTGFYRLAQVAALENSLTQFVLVGMIGDVVCEPNEVFALNLHSPINALIGKGQGTATIQDDDCPPAPVDVVIFASFPGPETTLIQEYLREAGITSRLLDRTSISASALAGSNLLVWDDCGASESGLLQEEITWLRQAHTDGLPLYLIGENIAAWTMNLAEPLRSQWTSLTGLVPGDGHSAVADEVTVLLETSHHVVNGAFGFVEDFVYPALGSATAAGDFCVVLARSGGSDVVLAHEEALTHSRRVVQNLLVAGHSENPASLAERRRLFLNSIWWLMAKPFCGLTDLSVRQAAAPSSAVTGRPITYLLSVERAGECPATGVIVTDMLPAGAILQSVETPKGSWNETNGRVTFNLGALDEMLLELRVTVVPTVSGLLTNIVKIRGNERDPSLGNNRSSLGVAVAPSGGEPAE